MSSKHPVVSRRKRVPFFPGWLVVAGNTVFFLLNPAGWSFAAELPTVADVLIETPFSAKHVAQVLDGKISATKVVPVSKSELAQGVACLVSYDAAEKLDTLEGATWLGPEKLLLAGERIPAEPVLTDFNNVQLHPQYEDETEEYLDAKAGIDLNLSLSEIASFNQLKTSVSEEQQPIAVDQRIRELLLTRHQLYRANGVNGRAPYARKKGREVQPLEQLKISLEESLGLKNHYPAAYSFLEQYPHKRTYDIDFSEAYFWYIWNLDDRPAVGLSHRLHINVDDARFIIERGHYVSHSLENIQILVAIIPVQEGTLLVYINRTWTHKVTGFFTRIKKMIGYKMMMSEMEHVMENLDVCGDTSS
jgi:hypothetical protein